MKKSVYDVLKFIAQIVLPAFATLVGTLGGIWHWNYVEPIVATISAVDVFLGAILMIDSNNYFKNRIIINTEDGKDE